MNCNTTHYRANSSSVPGDPTDYARALYDAGRYSDALAAWRKIRAPRTNHHAFMAACCRHLGDDARRAEHVTAAGACSTAQLVKSIALRDPARTERLHADLTAAGLPA